MEPGVSGAGLVGRYARVLMVVLVLLTSALPSQAQGARHKYSKSYIKLCSEAEHYCGLRDPKKANEIAGKAVKLDPAGAQAYYIRGITRMDLRDPQGAYQDLSRAISLYPQCKWAYCQRGVVNFECKRPEQAVEDMKQSLLIDPSDDSVIGIARRGLSRAGKDIKVDWYKIIDTHPLKKAMCLEEQRQYREALVAYSKFVEAHPDNVYGWSFRGRAQRFLKSYDSAISDLDRALLINPTDDLLFIDRATCYEGLGKFDQAIADYDQAVYLAPERVRTRFSRAILCKKAGRYRKAIEDYDFALSRAWRSAEGYECRGDCYAALGEYRKALDDYLLALKDTSNPTPLYKRLAEVYRKLGKPERAVYYEKKLRRGAK
ncbi:MAG: tetratricopeptide repeat protein [Cyanobacteria bacterium HKST-UBA02]|nr:tetratricopeptide repeat protein [Cyanobacteria bacterium HKST-UBA02]